MPKNWHLFKFREYLLLTVSTYSCLVQNVKAENIFRPQIQKHNANDLFWCVRACIECTSLRCSELCEYLYRMLMDDKTIHSAWNWFIAQIYNCGVDILTISMIHSRTNVRRRWHQQCHFNLLSFWFCITQSTMNRWQCWWWLLFFEWKFSLLMFYYQEASGFSNGRFSLSFAHSICFYLTKLQTMHINAFTHKFTT